MDLQSIAEQFWNDGYVIIRRFYSPSQLAEIDRQLSAYIDRVVPGLQAGDVYYEASGDRVIKSMFRMHVHAPYFAQLSEDAQLRRTMSAIFTEGEVLCDDVGFFGKAARDGSVTPVHQDNAFNFWQPPYCLKASLAIDAATPENGAMWVQKESHKLGLLPHRASHVKGFSQTLLEMPDAEAYPHVQLCMEPGDLALHHTDCIHWSDGNASDKSRRMLSFIYRSSVAKHDEQNYARYLSELKAASPA